MKNEHQENAVPRGPLILMVPASNLVAIMSLDWLDGTKRAAVSAKTRGRNLSGKSAESSERPRQDFGSSVEPLSRAGC